MDVILLQRIEKLGQMGDVVKVRPGFARNFLLPQEKALRATKDNLAYFETQKVKLEAVNLKQKQEAEAVKERAQGKAIVIIRQAGESGQLYGSVSARDIADQLGDDDLKVGRNQVVIDRPIKTLGIFPVQLQLHPEVYADITVNVARSQDEADQQTSRGRALTRADLEEDVENEAMAAPGEPQTDEGAEQPSA
ncbi:50S ribosomal protein L9 [Fodinicurvata sp. EGI_FJ10296]|uniref:50S ribosomal protein L9 n=1 Tax=Fodinicurvata sp. EGI_FJ10296 TaxID=3231908 RepID=UPI00345333F3